MKTKIQTFSVNGAAEMLERDRRTITRALHGVPPDSRDNKSPRWKMATIVNALLSASRPAADRGPAKARLLAAQADLAETKAKAARGELLDAAEVEAEWSGVLRTVRAGMLAVPSRAAARLPHLSAHDLSEIDTEVRAVLTAAGRDESC
jgi:hypothetical protein